MSKEVKKITEEQLEKINKQQVELSDMLRSLGVLDCLLYTSPSPRD